MRRWLNRSEWVAVPVLCALYGVALLAACVMAVWRVLRGCGSE